MPRWDQTDESVRDRIAAVVADFGDLGDDYAIDVCSKCHAAQDGDYGNVLHPPYSETDYVCELCETPLTDEDN